jgi:hypothetical protein
MPSAEDGRPDRLSLLTGCLLGVASVPSAVGVAVAVAAGSGTGWIAGLVSMATGQVEVAQSRPHRARPVRGDAVRPVSGGRRSGRGLVLAVAGIAVLLVLGEAVICAGAAGSGARSAVAVLGLFGLWAVGHLAAACLCSGRRRVVPRSAAGRAVAVPVHTVAARRVRPSSPKRRAYPAALPRPAVFRAGT